MRLIDADEFKKRIDRYPSEIRDIAKKELRYVHTIDAEPIRYGKWEEVRDIHGYLDRCSVCGGTVRYDVDKYSRCPSCGAMMEIELDRKIME